ncbi:hypothetical protein BV210_18380 (plasmid) [Halorientalis sp. IM1011]|uniref:hypothetical protein n=1 Tax=Halorientalis sp. IM1011 TaxID=1932360 RepID=UPI00097CC7E2|nr:hypothetical protein [Halorientalis sp. IM1011]AQL44720.1 hypothetical protein BV210_18380 [Halorientalis sp. IM1011]
MDRRAYLGLVGMTSLAGCAKIAKLVGPASRAADDAVDDSAEPDTPTPEPEFSNGVEDISTEDLSDQLEDAFPIYSIDSRETVDAYGYLSWSVDIQSEVDPDRDTVSLEYQVTVRNGPAIDVYLMEQREFEHYRNGDNFLYKEPYSAENTKYADASGLLDVQNYVFLLDHSSAGVAGPKLADSQDADVTVEFTIE